MSAPVLFKVFNQPVVPVSVFNPPDSPEAPLNRVCIRDSILDPKNESRGFVYEPRVVKLEEPSIPMNVVDIPVKLARIPENPCILDATVSKAEIRERCKGILHEPHVMNWADFTIMKEEIKLGEDVIERFPFDTYDSISFHELNEDLEKLSDKYGVWCRLLKEFHLFAEAQEEYPLYIQEDSFRHMFRALRDHLHLDKSVFVGFVENSFRFMCEVTGSDVPTRVPVVKLLAFIAFVKSLPAYPLHDKRLAEVAYALHWISIWKYARAFDLPFQSL